MAHVLPGLGALAKKAGISDDDVMKVEETKEKLMDAFGAVDATLHNAEGKTFAEVADEITAGMETLKAFAKE